jgi:AcrR family transcriptional regulator
MVKRLKAAERRATILAAAKILFADKGYHGVSVDEIARRLGVSPAVLYQHFPSKEALYEEVLDTLSGSRESYIEAVLQGPTDFASVLRRICHIYVESIARDPDYLKMEMHSALEGGAAANRFFEVRWKSIVDFIEYSLRELSQQGIIEGVNERVASLMFQGMLREALYAKTILQQERYHQLSLEKIIENLIALFLNSVGYRIGCE